MRKIPTVFVRDPQDMKHVLPEVHEDCEWVLAGEGVATRKYDGTCVMLGHYGDWWNRREVKPGKDEPVGFVQADYDEVTGKRVGWVPASPQGFLHPLLDALGITDADPVAMAAASEGLTPGTYELCGPKINGNPEGFEKHVLIEHAAAQRIPPDDNPRTYALIRALVLGLAEDHGWEGIVYHHEDGRMAKIKRRDFDG